MKIIDKVIAIFDQYELKPLEFPASHKDIYSYLNEFPDKKPDYRTNKNDSYFINKYRKYISLGHYGFSIGTPIIPEWNEILDKIIELCIHFDPNFRIQQIKLKFGGICFYVESQVIEDILDIEIYIGKKLRDDALIY
jgi:hypothetical protein